MQSELVLEADKSVIEGMVRAFGAILDEARAQAKAAIEQPATAVHDYRRAVRRAESVVLLASPLMRKAQLGWIRKAVTDARRRTRVLRDLDAVMPVIGKLSELDLADPTALDVLKAWLEEARGEVATEELVAWRLRKNVRSLAGLAEMFAVGVHAWADYDLLIESLRESYRAARRAWAKADGSKKLDDVHAWRRATRTLRYQLELLESRGDLPASAALKTAHATFKDQVKELGQVTDLFALRGIIEDAKEHVIGVEWKPLVKGLDAVIAERLSRVFEDARVTFAVRPRDFVVLVEATDDGAKGADGAHGVTVAEMSDPPKLQSDGGDEG